MLLRKLIRLILVAAFSFVFFALVCIPFWIQGKSMEPTYHDRGFNFCWRPMYLFSPPVRHDVVVVRLTGTRVMLLKRVVGLEGETVEFRSGRLYVDGVKIEESYVRFACSWELPPRQVKAGFIYVVGDNRNVPMEAHDFGQTQLNRVVGGPLW